MNFEFSDPYFLYFLLKNFISKQYLLQLITGLQVVSYTACHALLCS